MRAIYINRPGASLIDPSAFSLTLPSRRDDVAELSVESLLIPEANGLTFEVKSDLAFSTIWEGDGNTWTARDYGWVLRQGSASVISMQSTYASCAVITNPMPSG